MERICQVITRSDVTRKNVYQIISKFKDRQSLWNHKQRCVNKSPTADVNKDYFKPESVHGVVQKSKNRDNRKRTLDSPLSDVGVRPS